MTISLIFLNIVFSAAVLAVIVGSLLWSIASQDRDVTSAAGHTGKGLVTGTRCAPHATPVAIPR
jgi:hypothetical protein